MYIKKNISTKVRLVIFILISVISAEGIFLISSQKENISISHKTCSQFKDVGSKQQCWESLIEHTLNQDGLDSAFNLVDYLYSSEPQFAADCHGFTHQLGEKAYKLFSQNQDIKLSLKASYCGFGFYHAFMESLLRTTSDLKQARRFCDQVGGQNELSRLSCFHGIGHGLLEDVPNPTLKGNAQTIIKKPLEICANLSKSDVEEYRCASGVFNVLAIYYQNPNSHLKVQANDPYLICNQQIKKNVKDSCYDQMNSLVLSLSDGSLLSAANFAENIKDDEFASSAIHGIAGAYGQAKVAKINYDGVVTTCKNIQPRLKSKCLEGFLLGMLEGGQPGQEYVEGKKFCSSDLLNQEEKISCFNNLIWSVSATNPQKLTEVCSNLEQQYRQNCGYI